MKIVADNSASCVQMTTVAREYCGLIENCNLFDGEQYWLRRMEKLLPRLHAAAVSLDSSNINQGYDLPNDDMRCELFMRLNQLLYNDCILWLDLDRADVKQSMCESLADDFTDIYFDVKTGLDKLEHNTSMAMGIWYSSFYTHWGQHLVDAETWLHAVEARNYNTSHIAIAETDSILD